LLVTERLTVNKRAARKFYMGRFNLKQLNYMEVNDDYRVKI